jgi:hypothetical protein
MRPASGIGNDRPLWPLVLATVFAVASGAIVWLWTGHAFVAAAGGVTVGMIASRGLTWFHRTHLTSLRRRDDKESSTGR